jgi:ribosomal protein S18 acetylase RimI-like enzyme
MAYHGEQLFMNFQIEEYQGTPEEDLQVVSLLLMVYVDEGYTQKSFAQENFAPANLRKRGELILAKNQTGQVLGTVILVSPSSPARQVAKIDEAEIHLLAVSPQARLQGIGSALLMSCEQRARSIGFSKIVLSTQPAMKEAQRLYSRLGYTRNPARDWTKPDGRTYLVYEKAI